MQTPSGSARPSSPTQQKIKFVCKWGGTFSEPNGGIVYERGETRLCTVPRSINYPQLIFKLKELSGISDPQMKVRFHVPGLDHLLPLQTSEDLQTFKDELDGLTWEHVGSSTAGASPGIKLLRIFILGNGDNSSAIPVGGNAQVGQATGERSHSLDGWRTSAPNPVGPSPQSPWRDSEALPLEASRLSPAAPARKAGSLPEGIKRDSFAHLVSTAATVVASSARFGEARAAHATAPERLEGLGEQQHESTGPALMRRRSSSTGRLPGQETHVALEARISPPALPRSMAARLPPPPENQEEEDRADSDGGSSGEEDEEEGEEGVAPSEASKQSAGGEEGYHGAFKSGRFAADTLSEVRAMLDTSKGGEARDASSESDSIDSDSIENCLNDLEAALAAGLTYKDKFHSQGPPEAVHGSGGPAAPPASAAALLPLKPKQQEKMQQEEQAEEMGELIPAHNAPKKPLPRLTVGSGMKAGEWTEEGWHESQDQPVEIPAHLQQINGDDLVKVKELGRGQFGAVNLAKWLGVEVAVKELHGVATAKSMAEMIEEATTLASMRHPCVIAFYGIVTNQESPATVLEYIRGSSLRSGLQKLKAHNLHSKRLRAAIAVQAARGMEYLHSRRIVHFDLKCDNLLCDLRDLMRPVVKIGDLGLSKKKAATFVSGNMRGTLPWMAPELFPSASASREAGQDDRVTDKVDVFSFGVCMWEIWTLGEQPYQGKSLPEIFAGVMNGTLRPTKPADAPADWLAIMQGCWASLPSRRPTFSQVAAALDHLVVKFDKEGS